MYNKKSVEDINVSGKKVLVRCDFNVPMDGDRITDDTRIVAALPTIKYLLANGAAVILCSHMGRPHNVFNEKLKLNKKEKAKIEALPESEQAAATEAALAKAAKDVKKLSLKPVADRLHELLGVNVTLAADVVGPDAAAKASEVKPGEILVLENVRFHQEEEKNDPEFAKKLADMADIYVNDAFGTAHRAHASTAGVAAYLPAVCGYLIQKEITVMGNALNNPKRPFVAILGGAKVSDKIAVIENLLEKVDTLIIGGGMAYTFIKALGGSVGNSLCELDKLDLALGLLDKAKNRGVKLLLPTDTVCAKEFDNNSESAVFPTNAIPDDYMGMDIGPATVKAFSDALAGAGTVVWNGPMGVFEFDNFAKGTKAVAEAVAACGAISIIGGGDSAAAVEKFGLADRITHISTGGGASLEFLQGLDLPGIAALNDK